MRLALARKTHGAAACLTAAIACCAACLCAGCTGAATHAAGREVPARGGQRRDGRAERDPRGKRRARRHARHAVRAGRHVGWRERRGPQGGAIEVAASPDGRFAFVTLENSQQAAVFNLGAAVSRGFGPADYVGSIPLELAPVGITVSPDGRWLYATSEAASRGTGTGAPGGASSAGTLTVIDLRRAETDPAASVVATVDAGCQPVRVTTAADGTQVWVTARASDDLLCFAAARLVSDPKRALVAAVRVGEAPVGLAAVRGSSLVVVADSNRFGASGATSDLDVVNVAAALAGRPAVVGHIRAGLFPRDMTLAPDGTLLVSNFDSGQVEAVDAATVPGAPETAG
jgi:DNA-binding beta-propeller fold protein YncE